MTGGGERMDQLARGVIAELQQHLAGRVPHRGDRLPERFDQGTGGVASGEQLGGREGHLGVIVGERADEVRAEVVHPLLGQPVETAAGGRAHRQLAVAEPAQQGGRHQVEIGSDLGQRRRGVLAHPRVAVLGRDRQQAGGLDRRLA